jgi:hypothetical protein
VVLGHAVLERMEGTRATLDALAEALAATSPTDPELADHHLSRIRALFGEDFPVLPRFVAVEADQLSGSASDVEALVAGDALAPAQWLQRMALVRPDTDALQRTLTAIELLGGTVEATELRVVQLPHVPGQRWAALPRPDGEPLTVELAIAFHASGPVDFHAPLAGLVCDDWTETIPSASETTGVSFHYDAPGARAPNAVLLAVPGDPASTTWDLDELVDVVREAADLAKIRLVDPRQLEALGTLVPTTCLPENFRHDVPSVDLSKLTAKADLGPAIMGKST